MSKIPDKLCIIKDEKKVKYVLTEIYRFCKQRNIEFTGYNFIKGITPFIPDKEMVQSKDKK